MAQSGGINESTEEVLIPVSPLVVHALSTTLLCLTGTGVMSMSCFPFDLPEMFLFRCPSRPELVHNPEAVGGRSASATPVTPSDDGIASNSPTSTHVDSASSPEHIFNHTSFSPPSQYLQVPDWHEFYNRHSGRCPHRPMARSGISSPAIMQSAHSDPTPNFLSDPSQVALGYSSYDTFDNYIPGTSSATAFNPWADNGHVTQGPQPVLQHSVSVGDANSTSVLHQSHSFPLFTDQRPHYGGPVSPEINSSSANTYFHASLPMSTGHDDDASNSFELIDQSLQSYNAVFEIVTQPVLVPPDQNQDRMFSTEYPASFQDAALQPMYWVTRTDAPRSHSTGDIDWQYLARLSDERR
ncbi:hypothetical protein QM012_008713 [Aureobasidium pullulans]|uniref:Uncharacterized protein n=1 Tax=Aureobasidium pullulans TaxID=5580 RepID=A0ABR0THF0_AURPU